MKKNKIITIDDYEKVVTDLLLYIEKETDFEFDYATAGGNNVMISIESCTPGAPSISCPAEEYILSSNNYCVGFATYVCECEGKKKIIEIALLPYNSASNETYIKASEKLTQIIPDIPISPHLRKREIISN